MNLTEALTEGDRKFLRNVFVPERPNQTAVDLSAFPDEEIQGYAIVLKFISGRNFF